MDMFSLLFKLAILYSIEVIEEEDIFGTDNSGENENLVIPLKEMILNTKHIRHRNSQPSLNFEPTLSSVRYKLSNGISSSKSSSGNLVGELKVSKENGPIDSENSYSQFSISLPSKSLSAAFNAFTNIAAITLFTKAEDTISIIFTSSETPSFSSTVTLKNLKKELSKSEYFTIIQTQSKASMYESLSVRKLQQPSWMEPSLSQILMETIHSENLSGKSTDERLFEGLPIMDQILAEEGVGKKIILYFHTLFSSIHF